MILPFRATHLNLLPSILKNFGRVKAYTTNPFRIIIAPITLANDYDFSVADRIQVCCAHPRPSLFIFPPSPLHLASSPPRLPDKEPLTTVSAFFRSLHMRMKDIPLSRASLSCRRL